MTTAWPAAGRIRFASQSRIGARRACCGLARSQTNDSVRLGPQRPKRGAPWAGFCGYAAGSVRVDAFAVRAAIERQQQHVVAIRGHCMCVCASGWGPFEGRANHCGRAVLRWNCHRHGTHIGSSSNANERASERNRLVQFTVLSKLNSFFSPAIEAPPWWPETRPPGPVRARGRSGNRARRAALAPRDPPPMVFSDPFPLH